MCCIIIIYVVMYALCKRYVMIKHKTVMVCFICNNLFLFANLSIWCYWLIAELSDQQLMAFSASCLFSSLSLIVLAFTALSDLFNSILFIKLIFLYGGYNNMNEVFLCMWKWAQLAAILMTSDYFHLVKNAWD